MTLQQYETTNTLPDVFTTPARQDTDSWVEVMSHVVRLAQEVATTDFVPRGLRGNVPATAAAMLYGREVGLPPMTALTSIHVIEGRPGMAAEAMRSLVFAAGHEIVFDEATGAQCRMRARRRGKSEWTALAWTIDMARSAGLTGKDNWKKYPRAMLIARCTTDLCRMVFPDVIHGFRSTEELEDMGEPSGTSAPAPDRPARSTKVTRKRTPAPAPEEQPQHEPQHELPPLPEQQHPTDAGAAQVVRPDAAPAATPEAGASSPDSSSGVVPENPGASEPSRTPEAPGPRTATRPQVRMLHSQMGRLGLGDDREERMLLINAIIGRELATTNDLTFDEAQAVITTASSVRDADALRALVAAVEAGEASFPGATPDSAADGDAAPDTPPDTEVEDPPEHLLEMEPPQGRDRG